MSYEDVTEPNQEDDGDNNAPVVASNDDEDMDYIDVTPEPNDEEKDEFGSIQSIAHTLKASVDFNNMTSHIRDISNMSQTSQIMQGRRSSLKADNSESMAIIHHLQTQLEELHNDNMDYQRENEKLSMQKETIQIESENKVQELTFELDESKIKASQYQLRYETMTSELNQMRSSQFEVQADGKEKEQLLLRMQEMEQTHMDMAIEIEQSNSQNETLKHNLSDATLNASKLQKAMIAMKKDKTLMEKNLQTIMDRLQSTAQQSQLQLSAMNDKMIRLQRNNDMYAQRMKQLQSDNVKMQQDFTEQTMELLHTELNTAHDDNKEEAPSLRISAISTADMERQPTQDVLDSPITTATSFVKQRFGSTTSLPDNSLLNMDLGDDTYGYDGHSRKGSMDSEYGGKGYENSDKLKADIREILVQDVKTMLNQEMANMSITGLDKLPNKIDQLIAAEKNKSIQEETRQNARHEERKLNDEKVKEMQEMQQMNTTAQLDEETLTNMLGQLKNSMHETLQKDVVEQMVSLQSDASRFEEAVNENLGKIQSKLDSSSDIENILQKSVEDQMTALQISLGNDIESSVERAISKQMQEKIDEGLRNNIKTDMTTELKDIREMLNDMKNGGLRVIDEDNNDAIDGNNDEVKDEEEVKTQEKNVDLKEMIANSLKEFRQEIVPEIQSIFEQLSNEHIDNDNNGNSKLGGGNEMVDDDDEKMGGNANALLITIDGLRQEINKLKEDKEIGDQLLKEAATSKVHQTVKLQNLIDHMRNDNRILQIQMERFRDRCIAMQNSKSNNVVNKIWGSMWGSGGGTSGGGYSSNAGGGGSGGYAPQYSYNNNNNNNGNVRSNNNVNRPVPSSYGQSQTQTLLST